MLNKFNSNAKKQNKVLTKINTNNLNDDLDLTGSLLNVELPPTTSYQSSVKSPPNKVNITNTNKYTYDMAKLATNAIKAVNNKTHIFDFHDEILQFSGRTAKKGIDTYTTDGFGTLQINNVKLDYGTQGVSPNNFEILIGGLHIPGNYIVNEVGNDVVITLNDSYIDFGDGFDISNIYVIGKFINI